MQVWRPLLPGLAQMWFRCFWMFQNFPYKLMLLVADDVDSHTQNVVVPHPLNSALCVLTSSVLLICCVRLICCLLLLLI